MYLTKLRVPLTNRKAAEALGDCQKMHRMICGLFGTRRQDENILYRVHVIRGSIQIYLYSEYPPESLPETVQLAGQRDLTQWIDGMSAGNSLGFDLLTCPSKKVYQAEKNKNSRRRILREPQERLDWLKGKAEQNGFRILDVWELEQSHNYGRHSSGKGEAFHLDAYHYQGILCITDADLFRKAIQVGIGPEKAYGLGMLMVKNL